MFHVEIFLTKSNRAARLMADALASEYKGQFISVGHGPATMNPNIPADFRKEEDGYFYAMVNYRTEKNAGKPLYELTIC